MASLFRKVEVDTHDPKYQQIGKITLRLKEERDADFFFGWSFHRRYTADELNAASCFMLSISAVFEPAGESSGTTYDESATCEICGAGAPRLSSLRLDLRRVPKNKDIRARSPTSGLFLNAWLSACLTPD